MHVDSWYPFALSLLSPVVTMPKPALRTCSCGQILAVRDQVPIGVMDDGEGGTLVLYNCPACRTTLSEEVKP